MSQKKRKEKKKSKVIALMGYNEQILHNSSAKSAKFNDFLKIHRHLQPLPQSNLNTLSVPEGNSYLLAGARFPPQCSGARSPLPSL